MERTRTSSALELLVGLRRDDPGAAPSPARARASRRDPGWPARAVRDPALDPRAGRPARRLARDRRRGLRAARRRGLPRQPPRRARPGSPGPPRRRRRHPSNPQPSASPSTSGPGRPDLDLFPRLVWSRAVRRVLAEVPSDRLRLPRRARDARAPSCARDLPQPGPRDGRGSRRRRRSARASPRVWRSWPASSVRRMCTASRSRTRRTPSTGRRSGRPGLDVVGHPGGRLGHPGRPPRRQRRRGRPRDGRPPVPARRRPARRSPGGARGLGRARRARWSSRTTTTPSSATTASRSGRSRACRPTTSSTPARRARSWPPGCGSAGSSRRAAWSTGSPTAKKAADMGSSALDQLAFADVVDRGELDHHLRRMRPIYRRRRDALLATLARHLPGLRPVGASAGLHVLAWLPPDLDERRIVRAAARGRDRRSRARLALAHDRARRPDLRLWRHRRRGDRRGRPPAGRGDRRGRMRRRRAVRRTPGTRSGCPAFRFGARARRAPGEGSCCRFSPRRAVPRGGPRSRSRRGPCRSRGRRRSPRAIPCARWT